MRQFFKNMLHPMQPQDVSHLYDDAVMLKLNRYQYGTSYVGGLPSYFFTIADAAEPRREMGSCDLRVGMSAPIPYAGHIGYRIYAPYRGHHYAEHAARLLLHFACELGMPEVIITCDPDNMASRRTLERLGGRFLAVVDVPEESPCYQAGDRQKCQFVYRTGDYYLPEKHNSLVCPAFAADEGAGKKGY